MIRMRSELVMIQGLELAISESSLAPVPFHPEEHCDFGFQDFLWFETTPTLFFPSGQTLPSCSSRGWDCLLHRCWVKCTEACHLKFPSSAAVLKLFLPFVITGVPGFASWFFVTQPQCGQGKDEYSSKVLYFSYL